MHNRRSFLKQSSSCASWIMGLAAASPLAVRQAFGQTAERKIVAKESWGRLEEVADGIWALVSTPFETRDFTTVSNGGIIAGKDKVLVIEALNQPKGAKWLAEQAQDLTGRWPTDVVVTHYHSDHSAGSSGYQLEDSETRLWLTTETKTRIEEQNASRNNAPPVLSPVRSIDSTTPMELDLGDRSIRLSSCIGHTSSDVIVEVTDPNVIFCGDLFFNRLVPNYMDAKPNKLKQSVASLERESETLYVPGHGSLASPTDLKIYQDFLAMIEDAVTASHKKGDDAQAAAASFKLPEPYTDWYIFSPQVIPRAFASWYRELG